MERPKAIDAKEWATWDEASKIKLLERLELATMQKKVWFCKRGRVCDGKPHDEYDYPHARGDQWPPPGNDWLVWLLNGGRGAGKTRSGAEWIRYLSATFERVSIIGPTWSHVRDYMVEGDSGLLVVFANAGVPVKWEPSKRKLTVECKCKKPKGRRFPVHRNGHLIQVFTGEEPNRLRGPVHWAVWLDEPAHMPLINDVWDMMMMGLRGGQRTMVLCTTTPLPIKWMRDLIKEPDTVIVTSSTYKNLENLTPNFRKTVIKKYEGTRTGRQELDGEILDDVEGALWKMDDISETRSKKTVIVDGKPEVRQHEAADMERIVVAIDPAGSSKEGSDETGIVVVGKIGEEFYVLADYSNRYTPEGWASAAWEAFDLFQADFIVAEKNYGGEMVRSTLHNARKNGPVKLVDSRRGKLIRAEPISSLYEQHKVHHVGIFKELEEQMTTWIPGIGDSPDRVDALVHGITHLNKGGGATRIAVPGSQTVQHNTSFFKQDERAVALQPVPSKSLFGWQPRDPDRTIHIHVPE